MGHFIWNEAVECFEIIYIGNIPEKNYVVGGVLADSVAKNVVGFLNEHMIPWMEEVEKRHNIQLSNIQKAVEPRNPTLANAANLIEITDLRIKIDELTDDNADLRLSLVTEKKLKAKLQGDFDSLTAHTKTMHDAATKIIDGADKVINTLEEENKQVKIVAATLAKLFVEHVDVNKLDRETGAFYRSLKANVELLT